MKKQDWKNLAIFLLLLLITSPLIYYTAYWLFNFDEPVPKALRFSPILRTRQGELILIGESQPCPVIPTSLCEGKSLIVPTPSTDEPTRL